MGISHGTPEDGYVRCENEESTNRLDIYVGKTQYPFTNLAPAGSKKSYANGTEVMIYQNKWNYSYMGFDDFMVTFEKNGLYYLLKTTDMTLKELVAVLEELMGGEFSKTTRPTTTTTFYTSERTPTTTTVA